MNCVILALSKDTKDNTKGLSSFILFKTSSGKSVISLIPSSSFTSHGISFINLQIALVTKI